jgi:ACR3 family arsenite transporter
MVFVWSLLVRGDSTYTVVQVALNDLIMLVAFAPIVMVLLGLSDIAVPWSTVALSVVLFVVTPVALGRAIRTRVIASRGRDWFETRFMDLIAPLTPIGLIITLVLLFSFQGDVLLDDPLHIALIAVPLSVQTIVVYAVTLRLMRWRRVRHEVAAPGALVGASNFFELAVATAIALFGLGSGAALATVVGVLVEVPLMLVLVEHARRAARRFPTALSA